MKAFVIEEDFLQNICDYIFDYILNGNQDIRYNCGCAGGCTGCNPCTGTV